MNLCLTKFIVYVLENVLKSVSNRNYVCFKISDRALIPLNFLHRISMYNFFLAFLYIFFLGIDLVTYQILQTSDFALFPLNAITKNSYKLKGNVIEHCMPILILRFCGSTVYPRNRCPVRRYTKFRTNDSR